MRPAKYLWLVLAVTVLFLMTHWMMLQSRVAPGMEKVAADRAQSIIKRNEAITSGTRPVPPVHDPPGPLPMPALVYGTAWKREATRDLVLNALQTGYRAIDTACQPKHYQEPLVGEAITEALAVIPGLSRRQLYIQTKYTPVSGQDPRKIPYNSSAPVDEQVTQSVAVSLRNLRTSYVDALLLHSPINPWSEQVKAWRSMEKAYEAGSALRLGISNCYDLSYLQRLYETAIVKPTVVQNRFYKDSHYDVELRVWARDHNITYQSFWTLSANKHVLAAPAVVKMAADLGKTEPQVFFRYLSQNGIVPLTGTKSPVHMQQDLDILSFKLAPDQLRVIDDLLLS